MRWWQILAVLVGLVLVLGAVLVVIDTVLRLYNIIAIFSPLLANLVVGVIVLMVLIALGFGLYYLWLFLRPRRRRQPPSVPRNPVDAARTNLSALEQQVEQIQDRVAQTALREKTAHLHQAMAHPALSIAVFGVGSAGKTSIINALLEDTVGEVGAAMGTTQSRHSYQWQIPDVPQSVTLIDTPGLAEAGVSGTLREQAAREIAAESNLILFIIDDDLRQAEYAVLQSLLSMGKRALVVLNKADRFPAAGGRGTDHRSPR